MIATDLQDVLFGCPYPLKSSANLGILKEDHVNIIIHGHEPLLSEMIVQAAELPEMIDLAKEKGLAIVAGTQRRHQKHYLEVMKRLRDGAIGEVVGGQCYWNQGGLWVKEKEPGMSDMEWMCRNSLYFTWLSGDHIVEQHVHNIDVINWAIGTHPVSCMGMGGRHVRIEPKL